jgi:hypothetical protein
MARLEQVHDGRMIGFGPFVGYYFRPEDPRDLSRLQFICFNENRFYSSDMPDGAKLYEGTAARTTLPQADITIPNSERINPVFFPAAPAAWLNTRPEPQDVFVHFHSGYNAAGPVRTGYWLRHIAVADFTYDMGGRVEEKSPQFCGERDENTRPFSPSRLLGARKSQEINDGLVFLVLLGPVVLASDPSTVWPRGALNAKHE